MPTDPIHHLLVNVESQSAVFGTTATQLSVQLEELDARLAELPGKIPVQVGTQDAQLSFHRDSQDSQWKLWYGDATTASWRPVTELQVKQKIQAAKLIEPLLSRLYVDLKDANETIAHLQGSAPRES